MERNTDLNVSCFSAADILLPREADLQRWAVIACDQFTSQPEYWKTVEKMAEGIPSAYHLILPESELGKDCSEQIKEIHRTMANYLEEQIFIQYSDCFVYTERVFPDGKIRRGLVGKIDLEQYDYSETANSKVRATEKTVSDRIPPRMQIRRGAALELPHILLLCNDEKCRLIEPFSEMKNRLQILYDFDLMMGGGHVSGWLIIGELKKELEIRIAEYEEQEMKKHPECRMVYAAGDGNHSLAAAKACYEELKKEEHDRNDFRHPARFALCELNNIHDPNQCIEPIHRIVKNCDTETLVHDLLSGLDSHSGIVVPWGTADQMGTVAISPEKEELALTSLQRFLDRWLQNNPGELDYIHGESALKELEKEEHCIGFQLPPLDKNTLFSEIMSNGCLPRKTFSLGEAEEKRYYLEARKIN